jgi:hypothetical protein
MSDAREDNLLTTDAGGSGTGDALTPEGAGRRPQRHEGAGEDAGDATQDDLLTDPQTTGAAPESTDPGRSGDYEQADDSAGSGRDA